MSRASQVMVLVEDQHRQQFVRRYLYKLGYVGRDIRFPPLPSRRVNLDAAVDRNGANEGVISAAASRVAIRVIRTDNEQTIVRLVCRELGVYMPLT